MGRQKKKRKFEWPVTHDVTPRRHLNASTTHGFSQVKSHSQLHLLAEEFSVFILGATGYIGGSVLTDLVASHPLNSYTALIWSQDDAAAVDARALKPSLAVTMRW